MNGPLFTKTERDKHKEAFLATLSDFDPLKRKALKCGSLDYWSNNTFYCRLVACPRCRYLEQNKQISKLKRLYAEACPSKMMMITICFAVVASLDDVAELWSLSKKAINYIVVKNRSDSYRWTSFRMNAFLEIMPFRPEEVLLVGDKQQEMLDSMGMPRPLFEDGPLWLVHIHAIAHAPDLAWQEVRDALTGRWPNPYQIKVEPFYASQEKEKSIERIVRYSSKYAPGRMIGNARFEWPLEWMSEFYQWAFGFSRSYQSFKFSISPKVVKRASDTLRIVEAEARDDFSISPIPLTDRGSSAPAMTTVELPLDYSEETSGFVRRQLEDWCRLNCEREFAKQWLVADDIARFSFADAVEAVAFKLRFSDLLSQGP